MTSKKYDHKTVEKKWQDKWEEEKIYSPDIKNSTNKFFNLWMFPYPSAEGLHAGHAFASTGSDVFGRYMRMQGKNVFQPIGYDSFGIHSENYAIKIGEDPHEVVKRTTQHYAEQLKSLGHGYDWNNTVTTSDVDYYRWTQWLFVEMFKAGLAYKKTATVNFCPSCKTVLADEQVVTPASAGKGPFNAKGEKVPGGEDSRVCERCGTIVEKKDLDQWFFRITDYADKLLTGLEKIDWSCQVKLAQKNWIGKSHGMLIKFKVEGSEDLTVFTTRPDTLNAVTFIAISDEEMYNKGDSDKIGEFTGKYAVDPLSNRKLPIWKTNYIAPGYGTGAVMGVPAHDKRDMEFANKYHIDIVEKEPEEKLWKEIEEKRFGKTHTNYHLRDWLVSRQRYWGAPIPMVYCESCVKAGNGWLEKNKAKLHPSQRDWDFLGWWPVEDLPVELPTISDYKPEGTGKGPLGNHPDFYKVSCPHCGSSATRETDVMDTFVDSSWYFLRYPSTHHNESAFNPEITEKWLPVDLYFGGAEHSVLHLMYARFVTRVLKDLKYLEFEEPFTKFFAHGLMIKDGAKMSKSRGNVVNPDEYIQKFGADTLRLYVMFLGPMDAYPDFRDAGIEGMQKFVTRLWNLFTKYSDTEKSANSETITKLHQTIMKVTEDMQSFKYNTAISSIMELTNTISDKGADKETLKTLCLLIAPFAPHLAEEIWVEILSLPFSVHNAKWPDFDIKKTTSSVVTIIVQINGKVRSTLKVDSGIAGQKEKILDLAKNDGTILRWLTGKTIKKEVFIPEKIVNFVVD